MAEIISAVATSIGEGLWFLWSVIKQWKVLVTGVAFTLAIGLGEHYVQRSITLGQYLGILAVLVFWGCFLAWREEYRRVLLCGKEKEEMRRKYFNERPKLGLCVMGNMGQTAWNEAIASDNLPVGFYVEHLSGRIPTSVRFDPISSKHERYIICFEAISYVKPPARIPLEFSIREDGVPPFHSPTTQRIAQIKGQMLTVFLCDSPEGFSLLEYPLTARFKDGDEELTQPFTLRFNERDWGFESDTTMRQ